MQEHSSSSSLSTNEQNNNNSPKEESIHSTTNVLPSITTGTVNVNPIQPSSGTQHVSISQIVLPNISSFNYPPPLTPQQLQQQHSEHVPLRPSPLPRNPSLNYSGELFGHSRPPFHIPQLTPPTPDIPGGYSPQHPAPIFNHQMAYKPPPSQSTNSDASVNISNSTPPNTTNGPIPLSEIRPYPVGLSYHLTPPHPSPRPHLPQSMYPTSQPSSIPNNTSGIPPLAPPYLNYYPISQNTGDVSSPRFHSGVPPPLIRPQGKY